MIGGRAPPARSAATRPTAPAFAVWVWRIVGRSRRMIRASLAPYLPRLEYHEWERCGHYPWLERAVREEFFWILREWLRRQAN